MMQEHEISTDHLIRALRVFAGDIQDKHSPFNKDTGYLDNLAGWLICAAARLDKLHDAGKNPLPPEVSEVIEFPIRETRSTDPEVTGKAETIY
jgi:hypothetical protein